MASCIRSSKIGNGLIDFSVGGDNGGDALSIYPFGKKHLCRN